MTKPGRYANPLQKAAARVVVNLTPLNVSRVLGPDKKSPSYRAANGLDPLTGKPK